MAILSGKNDHLVMFSDITERVSLMEQLKASLAQKEILLREVHHRVKNNIQVIASLLDWQRIVAGDDAVKDVLQDAQDRVKSIALVHERLYLSKSLDYIDYGDYLRNITKHLYSAHSVDPNVIAIRISAGNIPLHIDQAIPCSLIINELITNTFKHAFPDGRKGEIRIDLTRKDGTIHLLYSDNGIGLPENISLENATTLGMRLLSGLTRQMKGTIETGRQDGTWFRISFPEVRKDGES